MSLEEKTIKHPKKPKNHKKTVKEKLLQHEYEKEMEILWHVDLDKE